MSKSRTLRLLIATPAALLALMTAGCADNPGTAATVGSQEISSSELQSTTRAVATGLGETTATISQQAVLASMVQASIIDDLEAQKKLTITGAERSAALKAATANAPDLAKLSTTAGAEDFVEGLLDVSIAQQKLGTGFEAAYLSVPVSVNPRYGTWDPRSQQGVAGNGSLSVETYSTN